MKVELFDRHAENVDENVPLCVHDSWEIDLGSTVKITAEMEMPGWLVTSKLIKAESEIEIHFISKKHVRIIVNHADYLAAMAVKKEESA